MVKPLLVPSLFNESFNEITSIISVFINLKMEKAVIDEFINSRVKLYEECSIFKSIILILTYTYLRV